MATDIYNGRKKIKLKKIKYKQYYALTITLIILIATYLIYNTNQVINSDNNSEEKIKELKYNACLNNPYQSENLKDNFNALFDTLKGKNIAIYFSDLKNEYYFSFNETKVYYSASTAKLFDAIYLIHQAKKSLIDLNTTITFLPKYDFSDTIIKKNYKYYDEVSLKELITYAISVSDNASHFMLVNYIGANKLNSYFKDNYNLNLNLTNDKPFINNYTAQMANTSLKLVYDIIAEEDEYAELIESAMNNTYVNALNFDNETFLHKYGLYGSYYHDIGIYNGDNPYLISILTLYGKKDYLNIVSNIHKQINELYQENLKAKEEYCKSN